MRPQSHKRNRITNKTLALIGVLVLGGGGTAIVAANANATVTAPRSGQRSVAWTGTVDCPDVGDRLRVVPASTRREVDRRLAQLDTQVAQAYRRLAWRRGREREVLDALRKQRQQNITRIADTIARAGVARPRGLDAMSACQIKSGQPDSGNGQEQSGGNSGAGQDSGGKDGSSDQNPPAGNGPARADFVDITRVRPNVRQPRDLRNSSRGSFSSSCGTNRQRKFNSDNVIVAPGVSNGAHHMHDYVGNRSTDAFSTNESLAASGTTCSNGDQSTYYWPVLRLQDGRQERDANAPGGGTEGNAGTILTPREVTIKFVGSPVSKVTAMPRFLRIITGDAKAFTNGTANANASWSCTGFENRQLKDKYPLCPRGSNVVRTFKFQSCWDGQNTDSANHRTHVTFAQADGRCPSGFRAIPQLVQRIVYAVPGGGRSNLFAVDSFPEQLHKPVTDHGDFINVMQDRLMRRAVGCINGGRTCR
ncbi:DUF1996 domain-containing protein [Streptomyces sp. NPDC006879]|uniref:DUF1996 domain-containing protein n=1 Tax=Streptomyces sp. NPDC006879 TaxID=3364767 RepID=UPI0036A67669